MPNGLGKDMGNPSWRRSLPHVLVATISSFLFGYHLGYALMKLIILFVLLNLINNLFILFALVIVNAE